MEKENNTNIDFSEFIKQNREKIISITPKNPTVKKDDEWNDETEWDHYNKHLMEGQLMDSFNVGDVWWAKFPYEDEPDNYTIRPVVILDQDTIGLLSVKVTKHDVREYDPYDTPIIYWNEAGLKLASTARVSKTMILDESLLSGLNNSAVDRQFMRQRALRSAKKTI